GRGRVQAATDIALGPSEKGHRWGSHGGETDPDPALPGMVAAEERAERLYADVGGKHHIARGDQLLSAALGRFGAHPGARESPDDHRPGGAFNQAVRTESDQRD